MRRYKANPDSALQIHTVKPEEVIPSNTLNFQSKCHYTLHSIYYDPHSDRFKQVDSYNSYAAVGYQAKASHLLSSMKPVEFHPPSLLF